MTIKPKAGSIFVETTSSQSHESRLPGPSTHKALMALETQGSGPRFFLARYDTLDSYRFQSGNRYDFAVRRQRAIPHFDTLLDPWLTYYILTSTYRSTLHSTCVLVVVYKPYAHMYLCTVQCTTYYILSTARLLVLQRARQQSLQSLVSSLSVLYSLQYGTLYPTVCPISWIEHRTDLEGSSIRYSLRVSQRGSSLSTLRTVPEKREAYVDDSTAPRARSLPRHAQPFIDHSAVFSLLTSVARSVEYLSCCVFHTYYSLLATYLRYTGDVQHQISDICILITPYLLPNLS